VVWLVEVVGREGEKTETENIASVYKKMPMPLYIPKMISQWLFWICQINSKTYHSIWRHYIFNFSFIFL